MAKKAVSFSQKARKKGQKDYKYVRYVKSVKSEKTGHWRFKETMVRVNSGENLNEALERAEKEALALHEDMEVIHPESVKMVAPQDEETSEVEEVAQEEASDEEAPAEAEEVAKVSEAEEKKES
jgi:divalent metal cation (Fe/Co/Zn/Cd) transporter